MRVFDILVFHVPALIGLGVLCVAAHLLGVWLTYHVGV